MLGFAVLFGLTKSGVQSPCAVGEPLALLLVRGAVPVDLPPGILALFLPTPTLALVCAPAPRSGAALGLPGLAELLLQRP